MDLRMIGGRLRDKYYTNKELFARDVTKMFDNCHYFNEKGSPVCLCADGLARFFQCVVAGLCGECGERAVG